MNTCNMQASDMVGVLNGVQVTNLDLFIVLLKKIRI